jgi:hypothetical protein
MQPAHKYLGAPENQEIRISEKIFDLMLWYSDVYYLMS